MELRRLAILSSVFACFSTSAPAFAATIVVDNDFADCPQADFNSIQAAVVASQPGDKILVCPGIYAESVVITTPKSDLRIEAQAAPGEVVLQGTAAQEYGFYLLNTTGVLVQGFTVKGYRQANIRIEGSADGISSGNTLRKNITTEAVIDGIELINSDANVVEHNISFANSGPRSDGIFVTGPLVGGQFQIGSENNLIRHNETFGNGQHGINLFTTRPGNVVFGNTSHHNRVRGITNGQGSGNAIENNYVFENGLIDVPGAQGVGLGIFISASTLVTVRNNRSESNRSGIVLNTAANNLVEKNEVFRNTVDGIRLQGNSDANTVQLNHIRHNGRDGIRVNDALSAGNTIERNVMRENAEHDAHDNGTANRWINNKCETSEPPGLCEHPGH